MPTYSMYMYTIAPPLSYSIIWFSYKVRDMCTMNPQIVYLITNCTEVNLMEANSFLHSLLAAFCSLLVI